MAFRTNGELLLIRDGTPFPALVRILPDGHAEEIVMSGSVVTQSDLRSPQDYFTLGHVIPHAARAVGSHALIVLADGNLAFLDSPAARSAYRIKSDGRVERIFDLPIENEAERFIFQTGVYGWTRVPESSDFLIVSGSELIRWNSKSSVSSTVAKLDIGTAVAVEFEPSSK